MPINKQQVEDMNQFAEAMFKLYQDAEGLRDCTEEGEEKEVFNGTRKALYTLRYHARKLAAKWERQFQLENSN